VADVSLTPLPPAEAIKYFQGKGLKTSFAWQDMWQEEHAKAFTVAKAMRPAVLQDIRDSLDKALVDGQAFDDWAKGLRPLLQAKGWWGKQKATDPLTGEEKVVQLGSPRRLRTIFDVNMRTAHAAGQWERIQETKDALQYLRYETAGDDRVRPEHAAWDGTTLPVDDGWWDDHNPPCDWLCRCSVTQVDQDEVDRTGVSTTDRPAAFPEKSYTNPRTGEVVSVEGGIGPGWGYNVGKAYLERDTPSPMGPPDDEDAGAAELDVNGAPAIEDFLAGFGASASKTVIFNDQSGDGLVIGAGLFKDSVGKPVRLPRSTVRALPAIGQALRAPDQVERAWRFGPEGDSLLVRRYSARVGPLDVTIDWSATGWWASATPR